MPSAARTAVGSSLSWTSRPQSPLPCITQASTHLLGCYQAGFAGIDPERLEHEEMAVERVVGVETLTLNAEDTLRGVIRRVRGANTTYARLTPASHAFNSPHDLAGAWGYEGTACNNFRPIGTLGHGLGATVRQK